MHTAISNRCPRVKQQDIKIIHLTFSIDHTDTSKYSHVLLLVTIFGTKCPGYKFRTMTETAAEEYPGDSPTTSIPYSLLVKSEYLVSSYKFSNVELLLKLNIPTALQCNNQDNLLTRTQVNGYLHMSIRHAS